MWVRWIGCRYVLPMMMKKRHVNLKFDMRLDDNNKVTVHHDTSRLRRRPLNRCVQGDYHGDEKDKTGQ